LTICKPQPAQGPDLPSDRADRNEDRTRFAEIHPHNTLQVITEKHVPDRDLGRNRLRFYTSRHASDAETERRTGPPAIYSSRPARAPWWISTKRQAEQCRHRPNRARRPRRRGARPWRWESQIEQDLILSRLIVDGLAHYMTAKLYGYRQLHANLADKLATPLISITVP
jgi:hypothetical protein